MPNTVSIEQALLWARARLSSDSAALDSRVLLCCLLDKPTTYLYTWPDKRLEDELWEQFQAWVERRMTGEPVAHITGLREFWSLPLKVNKETLIPRPDTEVLVESALELLGKDAKVLDLGTGTGAIALAIASELPRSQIVAIDVKAGAVALAKDNAERLGLENVQFHLGSWFEPLGKQRFDLIVSNPPYIDKEDPHLLEGDVRFEPLSALVADEKGLADLKHIATEAINHLNTGGCLMMEHGFEQGPDVKSLLLALGYVRCCTCQDYAGNDRVTWGFWSNKCI